MRKHYDFTTAKKNPYAKRLKTPVTIRLDESTVAYFNELAEETELPYQSLINLYLRDCASSGRRLSMAWRAAKSGPHNKGLLQPGCADGVALTRAAGFRMMSFDTRCCWRAVARCRTPCRWADLKPHERRHRPCSDRP